MEKYTSDSYKEESSAIPIQLTTGQYIAFVDPIDADLAEFSWRAAIMSKNVYASRYTYDTNNFRVTLPLHRVIMKRILGRELVRGEIVDHKDCDTLNNRRSNLRIVTRVQSNQNRRKRSDNTSGYKGVTWNKRTQRWRASIGANGKHINLGHFDNPEDAYEAYCKAAKELHGEFARLD